MPEAAPLYHRRTLAISAALLLVFVVLLRLEGRIAWCECGLGFYSAAWTESTSQHFLDPYTLTHISHGLLFYALLWPLSGKLSLAWRALACLALEIAWEVLENSPPVIARYRQDTAAFDYVGDSILNALGDVLAAMAGFVLAARVTWKAALAIFIALELAALYLAKDNLLLNILMLLYPLEAIKEWQMPG